MKRSVLKTIIIALFALGLTNAASADVRSFTQALDSLQMQGVSYVVNRAKGIVLNIEGTIYLVSTDMELLSVNGRKVTKVDKEYFQYFVSEIELAPAVIQALKPAKKAGQQIDAMTKALDSLPVLVDDSSAENHPAAKDYEDYKWH